MTLRQRTPRIHDAAHLTFVRAQPCCIGKCPRPSEAAHLRMKCDAIDKRPTGMSEKPDDRWTTPLCDYHHRNGIMAQHRMGEADFWTLMGLNPFEIATRLWIESGGAARALEPKPEKRPRKIKPRDHDAPKRKIQSRATFPQGRKLQSRGFEASRPLQRKSEINYLKGNI